MKSQEYRKVLARLPIENPTPEDMAALCPHLTPEEVVRAFTKDQNSYLACPPLRVRGGFQTVTFYAGFTEELKEWTTVDGERKRLVIGTRAHPPVLRWSFAARTPASYCNGKAHGDLFFSYPHSDRAMAFAEANWGDELTRDDWESVALFTIDDPTDLHKDGTPKTKAALYVTLSRELNEVMDDYSAPRSTLLDAAIAQMTLDFVIGHELKGGRSEYVNYNCAHCGSGLGLSGCDGCGHRFHDDQCRSGWSTPLSRKMVAFLREKGHVFAVDPEVAWAKEEQNWKELCRKREESTARSAALSK